MAVLVAAIAAANPASAVVGGEPADVGDYPWFTVVGEGCGGALIAPNRVLTAAHCGQVLREVRRVWVGPDELERKVRREAGHPVTVRERRKAQNEAPAPADLLILELKDPVTSVEPLAMARRDGPEMAPGTLATTMGFGATKPRGGGGGKFHAATVRVNRDETCEKVIPTALWRRWSLCTRDPRLPDPDAEPPFASACVGDSGGPLVVASATGPVLIGVVSLGFFCGRKQDPENYAVSDPHFALDPEPEWAPEAAGRPEIKGKPKLGSRLRCVPDWLVEPTKGVRYDWLRGRRSRGSSESRSPVINVNERDLGRKLRCSSSGRTAGGYGFSGLSRPVEVPAASAR